MEYFFSASTKGFYMSGIHSTIPNDAKLITKERYDEILSTVIEENQTIEADENGYPIFVTVPPIPLTTDQQLSLIKNQFYFIGNYLTTDASNYYSPTQLNYITDYRQTLFNNYQALLQEQPITPLDPFIEPDFWNI